jgi:hypothetical protein
VLCHSEGFILATGNGKGYINSYKITKEFEVRIMESYATSQDPVEITCLAQSYDKTYLVFAARFEDISNSQHILDEE